MRGSVVMCGAARADTPPALIACAHLLSHGGPPKAREPAHPDLYFCKSGFVGYMNPDTHVADWVVELLTPDRMEHLVGRRGSFRPDLSLPSRYRTKRDAFTNSGFVRGHLAPADNMRFSKRAMLESFTLSNVAPQRGATFNGSQWRVLEQKIQDWQNPRKVLVVITGTLYGPNPQRLVSQKLSRKTNRVTDVLIPDSFYKIIYAPLEGTALAFRFPHESLKGRRFSEFQVSIDELESESSYDFFAAFDDLRETQFEAQVGALWR